MKKSTVITIISEIIVIASVLLIYKFSFLSEDGNRTENTDSQVQVNSLTTSSSSGASKVFNIDDYIPKDSNRIVNVKSKGDISVYVAHIVTGAEKVDCFDSTPCTTFITRGGKLIYTNVKTPGKIEYVNLENDQSNDLLEIKEKGIVLQYDGGGEGMECSPGAYNDYVYLNNDTSKKIYQRKANDKCMEFFDENQNKLSLKATDIEKAYFEYYNVINN